MESDPFVSWPPLTVRGRGATMGGAGRPGRSEEKSNAETQLCRGDCLHGLDRAGVGFTALDPGAQCADRLMRGLIALIVASILSLGLAVPAAGETFRTTRQN